MSQRNDLCPSHEIVGGSKNVLMHFRGVRCDFSYDIQPPLLKRPIDSKRLEWDRRSFLLSNAHLTSLTVSIISMSVFEQGGPIIAGSQNFMSGSVSCKMSP
jgi:hypothetical protein